MKDFKITSTNQQKEKLSENAKKKKKIIIICASIGAVVAFSLIGFGIYAALHQKPKPPIVTMEDKGEDHKKQVKEETVRILNRTNFIVPDENKPVPDHVIDPPKKSENNNKEAKKARDKKIKKIIDSGKKPMVNVNTAIKEMSSTGGSIDIPISNNLKTTTPGSIEDTFRNEDGSSTFHPDVQPGTLPRDPKITPQENPIASMVQAHLLRANDYCRSGSGYYGETVVRKVRENNLSAQLYATNQTFKDAAERLGTAAFNADLRFHPMDGPYIGVLETYVKRGMFDINWNDATAYNVKAIGETAGQDGVMFKGMPAVAEVTFTIANKNYTFMVASTDEGYKAIDAVDDSQ